MKREYFNKEESKRMFIEYLRQLADALENEDVAEYNSHHIQVENIIQSNIKEGSTYQTDKPSIIGRSAVVGRRYTLNLEMRLKDIEWK